MTLVSSPVECLQREAMELQRRERTLYTYSDTLFNYSSERSLRRSAVSFT